MSQEIVVPAYFFFFLSCGRCLKELEILNKKFKGWKTMNITKFWVLKRETKIRFIKSN